jgi:hypothetical protein
MAASNAQCSAIHPAGNIIILIGYSISIQLFSDHDVIWHLPLALWWANL